MPASKTVCSRAASPMSSLRSIAALHGMRHPMRRPSRAGNNGVLERSAPRWVDLGDSGCRRVVPDGLVDRAFQHLPEQQVKLLDDLSVEVDLAAAVADFDRDIADHR